MENKHTASNTKHPNQFTVKHPDDKNATGSTKSSNAKSSGSKASNAKNSK